METPPPDPLDADSDGSDSFGERQIAAAEADGEAIPSAEGLEIVGDARPGRLIQVSGYAVNGAIRCEFAWMRYFDNGSSSYIQGENEAVYLVTADDVDLYLAVEVVAIGDGELEGETLRIYANEHRKISCDLKMQEEIERNFFIAHAAFDVSLMLRHKWEKVKLSLTRKGFSIRIRGSPRIVLDQKFLPCVAITVPKEHSTGFLIHFSGWSESYLLTAESSLLRDIIVLTMRLFLLRASNLMQAIKKNSQTKSCVIL
ncbi:uncharacterized protein [Typha latifolia]|uniref:uncharacterized protein n=1 Tax=Typha latifolia TaxID=4733 RepID=UPI003C2E0AB8